VRALYLLVMIAVGCGRSSSPESLPRETVPPPSPLLAAVGSDPRGFAVLSLAQPQIHVQLAALAASGLTARSLADCRIALPDLERLRVAVGAPLRIAAELDGKIDAQRIRCLLGDAVMDSLTQSHLVIRDRPGGIAVEYLSERAPTVPAAVAELVQRCSDASCAAFVLGPEKRRLWVQLRIDKTIHVELSGPSLGNGAAVFVAALDRLKASTPELQPLQARAEQGTLVVDIPPGPEAATALRTHVLEAFRAASTSMLPTLQAGDQFFVAKGALGTPTPGDVVAHHVEDRVFVTRYLAGPGQTIAETDAGISIDGKPLPIEVVDPSYRFTEPDEIADRIHERSGALVRERLGARSYLTLRTGPPHRIGTWTVRAGHIFVIGDNRNNSNDSRYRGTGPQETIIGRVVGVWLALRDGAPDWDRMGVPVE
jgi:signal peptidase I